MITKGIVTIPTQGFANRLRMVASSYIFSKMINTPLFVCWLPSMECNAEYNDIFDDADFHVIDFNKVKSAKYFYFGKQHTQNMINKIMEIHGSKNMTCDYLILEGGHEFKDPSLSVQSFVYQKHMFYKSLQFSNVIRDKVSYFDGLYDLNKTIGIHYRDIINKYDGQDIQSSDLVNFTKNSPVEKFKEIVTKLDDSKFTHILIISNNPDIPYVFKNQFKHVSFITTSVESYERNNKNAIIESVIDFLVLSKTKMIIGTFYSSFSDEASFVNFIPKITPMDDSIKNSAIVYHCHNYTNKNTLPSLNSNDKIFFDLFGEGICNL
jgi:hypothetical protein